MKKSVMNSMLALALGLALASPLPAAFSGGEGNGGPFVSQNGSSLKNGASLSLGLNPGQVANFAFAASAGNAITVTWPVSLVSVTTTPAGDRAYVVSPTATAGDKGFIGVALNTAAVGETVYVAFAGPAVVNSASPVSKGDRLVTQNAAGSVTVAAAVTEANYTWLSSTALVGRALENAAAGPVRVFLGR